MNTNRTLGWLLVSLLILLAYICWPTRSQMVLGVHVRGPSEGTQLRSVRVGMSDSSQRTLETFETQLSASWSQGGWAFHGFKQWYGDMTEKILEASGEGLVLTITAPHCKTKQLRITRGDIRSNYDPPRIQVGGHGTGFHSAQVTYESICRIDLECELAASRPLQPTSGVAAPADSK